MKKTIFTLIIALLFSAGSFAQLTGTKNIPGDYPTVEAAIAALNASGVGIGGVTFMVAANHTETLSSPLAGIITASGTVANQIVFQKNGAGSNPLITASVGTTTNLDGIIVIAGGDYITFDGIDLTESAANTTQTTRMEFGYALVKGSSVAPFNGCQFVTIKNCTITLNKYLTATTFTNCYGIYSGNHTATAISQVAPTTITDAMNNGKFFNNTVSNVTNGFQIIGYNSSSDLFDQNNEIGVDGANIITNFNTIGISVRQQNALKIANNSITSITTPATSIYGIYTTIILSSDIYNNTVTIQPTDGNRQVVGLNVQASMESYTGNIYGNTVHNCTNAMATSSGFSGIVNSGYGMTTNFYSNTVTNNTIPGTGQFIGTDAGGSSVNLYMYDNTVSNNTKTGISGSFTCLRGAALETNEVHNNLIFSNYNSTSAVGNQGGAINGINCTSGNPANIYNNNIYDLSANGSSNTAVSVNGINVSGGTKVNIYNNYVSDLRAPSATNTTGSNHIAGIYNTTPPLAMNIYFNTVYLNASSTGENFYSTALYTSNGPMVDIRNNVFINLSTPTGTGIAAAYRRTSTDLSNFSNLSTANCYYAGPVEDANHAIYYDGTASYTMSEYQALVGPLRESSSFRELPPFVNVASTPYDLHISTTSTTLCESGGVIISSPIIIADDFDGNIRASLPDVGADEFAGIFAGLVLNPAGVAATLVSSHQIDLSFAPNPSSNNVVIIWNTTGAFTTPSGDPANVGNPFAGGTVLYIGTTSPISHTGLNGATSYYYKAFSYDGSFYSTGVTVFATTNIETPTSFTASTISDSQIDLAWTKNAFDNDVIIATNSIADFGQPVNGTVYAEGDPLPTAGTVVYVGPLSGFSHTGLLSYTAYYYKIWSYDPTNLNIYSLAGAEANVTTYCSTESIPYLEDFEHDFALGCGTIINQNNDFNTWTIYYNLGQAHSPAFSLRISGSAIGGNDDWLMTNGLELTAGVSYDVKFWTKKANAPSTHQLEVKWGSSPDAAGMTSPAIYTNNDIQYTVYFQAVCSSFTPATTGIYYVGIHCFSTSGSWLYLDDVTVDIVLPEPPVAFTASAEIAQINLDWTKNAAGNDVIISTNSTNTFDQPINGTNYPVGSAVGNNGTVIYRGPLAQFAHTGLLPLTTYYYKIWSTNGANYYSSTGLTANAITNDFQKVCVPVGWGGISIYNTPANPAIATVLAEIENEMQIILSTTGFYWPSQNVNLIGNWDSGTGYKIKMNQPACFSVLGDMVENKTVNTTAGANFLPVLCNQPVVAADIFSQFGNKMLFAYDFYSQNLYWPAGGISTLQYLEPGKAYLINMTEPGQATYTCSKSSVLNYVNAEPKMYENAPYVCNKSGVQHFISIQNSALADLEKGDFIGVFDAQGNCAGFTQYNGETGNLLLIAYGDDFTTESVDGLAEGEGMSFRIFRSSLMTEIPVQATFNSSMPNSGSFADMGQSLILKMTEGATSIQENKLNDVSLHPNPSNGMIIMEIPAVDQSLTISVENSAGQLVHSEMIEQNQTGSSHQLDLTKVNPGIYFVRITSNTQTLVKKVIIK